MKEFDFTIAVPVYRTNVRVTISQDQDNLDRINNKILANFGEQEQQFEARGRAYGVYISKKGFRTCRILIDASKISFGVVAHEVMHIVFYIMDYVNIEYCDESEEAFTCLTEYLIESIHQELGSTILG